MAKRCYDKAEERKLDNIVENPKKQFLAAGGRCKTKVTEPGVALFEWFVNVRYIRCREVTFFYVLDEDLTERISCFLKVS